MHVYVHTCVHVCVCVQASGMFLDMWVLIATQKKVLESLYHGLDELLDMGARNRIDSPKEHQELLIPESSL